MSSSFIVDKIEYKIVRNPHTNGPMIERVDGVVIENRKEVCRRFLRQYGWDDSMFCNKITNELERQINKIVNNGIMPDEIGKINPFRKERIDSVSKRISSAEQSRPFTGEDGHIILLNKPFLGGWLNAEGNIGHEIIDFLLTDNGEYFVYNNPWGVCPDDVWVDGTTRLVRKPCEKYVGKYMVLTSESKDKDFDIFYVIELKEKLHRWHTTSDQRKNKVFSGDPNIVFNLLKELDIKYNGKFLNEIYGYESVYVTFRGARIYKAVEPIKVTGLTYNFQRNKGYIKDDEFAEDYNNLLKLIEDSIASGALKEFTPRKVDSSQIGELNANKTFLDLAGIQENEQVYTNILHSVLEQGNLLKHFCEKYKEDKVFDSKGTFKVFRETKVVDGRMDVCGESDKQRIIIENKVYSGLNGIREDETTQLSTYHKWGIQKEMPPLCFVVAPNFRVSEIKREIELLDPKMADVYLVKSYGDIANFIEDEYKNGEIPESYAYYSLIQQIIDGFKNYAYTTKEDLYARMFLDATN